MCDHGSHDAWSGWNRGNEGIVQQHPNFSAGTHSAPDESLVAAITPEPRLPAQGDADREIAAAVRAVSRGERYLRPRAERLLEGVSKGDTVAPDADRYRALTERERSVLRYVALGHTAAEIAAHLLISPKSVDTYKRRIADKLHLTHRWEYVRFAYKLGILQADNEASPRL
jgi:DNA-binding NarL/FixJ family response regulator